MYEKIIVGHDGTEGGDDALMLARVLAEATGAEVLVTHVCHETEFPTSSAAQRWNQALREDALESLEAAVGDASEMRTQLVASTSPGRGLHDLAESEGADLIVVGSTHHHGLDRLLAGSVTETAIQGSPCAVAVAPAGFRDRGGGLQHIGVAFDGMPESCEALPRAAALAHAAGAELRVLTVAEPAHVSMEGKGRHAEGAAEHTAAIREMMKEQLERGLDLVPGGVAASGQLLEGGIEAIADQDDIDLLVMGSRGYGHVKGVLLGSVSRRLIRHARCPIVVCPRATKPERGGRPSDRVGDAVS